MNLGGLRPESITLVVSDLERSRRFYTTALGLEEIEVGVFGSGGRALVRLIEEPGCRPDDSRTTGLFHMAFLVPSRGALGAWLRDYVDHGFSIDGAADHLVSEAVYLHDPDGHGIEVYRDRPRDAWTWDGDQVRMATEPFDAEGVLAEAGEGGPWTIGHFHLRVSDLAATQAFYAGDLGFDVVCRFPGALFVSVDGYHHHLGLNVWRSRGGRAAEAGTARLVALDFSVASGEATTVTDPAGNVLRFSPRD